MTTILRNDKFMCIEGGVAFLMENKIIQRNSPLTHAGNSHTKGNNKLHMLKLHSNSERRSNEACVQLPVE